MKLISLADLWTSIRELGAAYALLAMILIAYGIGTYALLQRSASEAPSSRFLAVSLAIAGALVIVALGGAFISEFDGNDSGPLLKKIASAIANMHSANLVLVLSLLTLIGTLALQRFGSSTISDIGSMFGASQEDIHVSSAAISKMAFFAGSMLLVLVVLLSLAQYLFEGTFGKEYSSIAPFTIAGSDDRGRGLALATALQAKLVDIQRDAEVLARFKRRPAEDDDTGEPQSSSQLHLGFLEVLSKANLELKFQGVDVGGIFSWLWNWFAARKALQITLAEQDGKAIVSGLLRPDGSSFVYENIDKATNERIVAAVAFSMLRERLIAEEPEYKNLKWDDIETLLGSTLAVINLRSRSEVKMDDFKEHLAKFTDLIVKAPRLDGLLTVAAEAAMKSGEINKAIAFVDRDSVSLGELREELDRARQDKERAEEILKKASEAESATGKKEEEKTKQSEDADDDENMNAEQAKELITRFEKLRNKFVSRYNAQIRQRQRILSNCALPFVERLRKGEPAASVFGEALVGHRALLRIISPKLVYTPTVAIVGGVPQREVVQYSFDLVGELLAGRPAYDNFADTLGSIIEALAPQAKLRFIPLGTSSRVRGGAVLAPNEAEIGAAIKLAVNSGADVVVVPFPFLNKSRLNWIENAGSKSLIVSPAPTGRFQKRYNIRIEDVPAAFVADADVDGRFRMGLVSGQDEQPVSYPAAFWAPGTRVPVLNVAGMWQASFGSGYATAVAGAVFANLLVGLGKSDAAELLNRVRQTLSYPDVRNPENGVIDQAAALAYPNKIGPSIPNVGHTCS